MTHVSPASRRALRGTGRAAHAPEAAAAPTAAITPGADRSAALGAPPIDAAGCAPPRGGRRGASRVMPGPCASSRPRRRDRSARTDPTVRPTVRVPSNHIGKVFRAAAPVRLTVFTTGGRQTGRRPGPERSSGVRAHEHLFVSATMLRCSGASLTKPSRTPRSACSTDSTAPRSTTRTSWTSTPPGRRFDVMWRLASAGPAVRRPNSCSACECRRGLSE